MKRQKGAAGRLEEGLAAGKMPRSDRGIRRGDLQPPFYDGVKTLWHVKMPG
jgi:hypothetical protein